MLLLVTLLSFVSPMGCGDDGIILPVDNEDSLALMAEATNRARVSFPDALLVQVLGLPGPGGLLTADDTVTWEFDFMVHDLSDGLIIRLEDAVWSEPEVVSPFFGVVYADLNRVTLNLADALALVRAEGFSDAYNEWNLFQPLVPGDPPAFYYFLGGTNPYPGVILRVDTETGSVEYDSPPAQ